MTLQRGVSQIVELLGGREPNARRAYEAHLALVNDSLSRIADRDLHEKVAASVRPTEAAFARLIVVEAQYTQQADNARAARRPLDEKKLLDMLVDEVEDKYIDLLEGTRAHTANVDNYIKSVSTALDDDFQTQFYLPAFRRIRQAATSRWDVQLGQIETTTVLANNRSFAKVQPAATMEFDLPKRKLFLTEAFVGAKAAMQDYGALLTDPTFLALTKAYSGSPVAGQFGGGGLSAVRNVLPGLPTSADEMILNQAGPNRKEFGSALEALIPDPAIYKFETGTGYELRPVLSPDGQSVVFNFNYMYTTDVREPVRADEKHLGRVKRHFVNTDVQLGNYELREVSKYLVSLRASRTGQGVQLLQDIPGVGVLFRPPASQGSSLQQNLIYSQAVIFPTLFDLMGLRYADAVADLDPLAGKVDEFSVRNRRLDVEQRVFDIGSTRVDDALRIPFGERRPDLYRSQVTLPWVHPNGYQGPGLRQRDGRLVEGYDPLSAYPPSKYTPGATPRSAPPAGDDWPFPQPADGLLPGTATPHGYNQLPPPGVPVAPPLSRAPAPAGPPSGTTTVSSAARPPARTQPPPPVDVRTYPTVVPPARPDPR